MIKVELKTKNSEHISNILQGKQNKTKQTQPPQKTSDRQILSWKFHSAKTLNKVSFKKHFTAGLQGRWPACRYKLMI